MRTLRDRVIGKPRPFVVRYRSHAEFERETDRLRGQGLYLVASSYSGDGGIRTVWSADVRYAGCEAGSPGTPTFDLGGTTITSPVASRLESGPKQAPRQQAERSRPVGWWEDAAPACLTPEPSPSVPPAPAAESLVEHIADVAQPAAPEPAAPVAAAPTAAPTGARREPVPAGAALVPVSSFAQTTDAVRELFAGRPVVLSLSRADPDTARRVIGFFESYCRSAHAEMVQSNAGLLTIVPT